MFFVEIVIGLAGLCMVGGVIFGLVPSKRTPRHGPPRDITAQLQALKERQH